MKTANRIRFFAFVQLVIFFLLVTIASSPDGSTIERFAISLVLNKKTSHHSPWDFVVQFVEREIEEQSKSKGDVRAGHPKSYTDGSVLSTLTRPTLQRFAAFRSLRFHPPADAEFFPLYLSNRRLII